VSDDALSSRASLRRTIYVNGRLINVISSEPVRSPTMSYDGGRRSLGILPAITLKYRD